MADKTNSKYDWIGENFYDGFATVKLNNKWSFIDENNKLIGDGNQWFDNVYPFSEGYSKVKLDGIYHLLDKNGRLHNISKENELLKNNYNQNDKLPKQMEKYYHIIEKLINCPELTIEEKMLLFSIILKNK